MEVLWSLGGESWVGISGGDIEFGVGNANYVPDSECTVIFAFGSAMA